MIDFVKIDKTLEHWKRWQPELLKQQLSEARMVYPFLYAINISGFRVPFAVVNVSGLEDSMAGRTIKEGDSETAIYIPEQVQNPEITVSFVTLIGSSELEKWYETVKRVLNLEWDGKPLATHFQPDEIEYANSLRRDIMIHFLNFNFESIRSLYIKKVLPVKHSISDIASLDSKISLTTMSFNITSLQHNV